MFGGQTRHPTSSKFNVPSKRRKRRSRTTLGEPIPNPSSEIHRTKRIISCLISATGNKGPQVTVEIHHEAGQCHVGIHGSLGSSRTTSHCSPPPFPLSYIHGVDVYIRGTTFEETFSSLFINKNLTQLVSLRSCNYDESRSILFQTFLHVQNFARSVYFDRHLSRANAVHVGITSFKDVPQILATK